MTRFTYIYDTYCGWCYGASPVINALIDSGAEVKVMHRHLFQGANAHRMGDGFGQMALQYDKRIGQLTGQEFSEAYARNVLGKKDEVLASVLTANAAALVHDKGAKVEMALAAILQKARYVDGISASSTKIVRDALAQFGVTEPLENGEAKATGISRAAAKLQSQFGIGGVPALLKDDDGRITQINIADYYKAPQKIAALAA